MLVLMMMLVMFSGHLAPTTAVENAFAELPFKGTADLGGFWYPDGPLFPNQQRHDLRGFVKVEKKISLGSQVIIEGEVVGYAPHKERVFWDGLGSIRYQTSATGLEMGLLRQTFGRNANSQLDILNTRNTIFSLLSPEEKLGQPMIKIDHQYKSLFLEAYGLVGLRKQPVPEQERRFSLPGIFSERVRRGRFGDQAIAARLGSGGEDLDIVAHVFHGMSRIPGFSLIRGPQDIPVGFQANYDQVTQLGLELETTIGSNRIWSEGFYRWGFRDIDGRKRNFAEYNIGIEHQAFNFMNSGLNVFLTLQADIDNRMKKVNRPYATALRPSLQILTESTLPWKIESEYLHDLVFGNPGLFVRIEKTIQEDPSLKVAVEFMDVSKGFDDNIITDNFRKDLTLAFRIRLEV